MTALARSILVGLCVVPTMLVLGCSSPPPSKEAVLYYLRNARLHGQVQRAWPEGQAYVDRVLKADAKLQKELAHLEKMTTPLSLWDRGDPRWQDEAAVTAEVASLTALQKEHGILRAQAAQQLGEAIAKLPKDMPLGPAAESRESFIQEVWKALAIVDLPLPEYVSRLEALESARLALYEAVLGAADQWDKSKPGLKFKDAAVQTRVDAQYAAFQKAIGSGQAAFVAQAEKRLSEIADRLKVVNRERDRWEYLLLGNERKYWRTGLERISKGLKAVLEEAERALKEAQEELKTADGEEAKVEVRIGFEREQVERLGAEYDQMKARVGKILEEDTSRAAAAAASKSGGR